MTTHLIPAEARPFGRNQYRARCGEPVHGWQHARNGDPECAACKRLDAEDDAAIEALRQMPNVARVSLK